MLFRVQKNKDNPYVMMNKSFLMDCDLSAKAKGILGYILTLPDDWQIYLDELTTHFTDGRDSIRNGIKELLNNGYIVRSERNRDEKGHLKGYTYDVYEVRTYDGKSNVGKSYVGKSNTTNKELDKVITIQNNKTTTTGAKTGKDVVVDADALKKEIDKKLNAKISKTSVNELLLKFGAEKVKYYLSNWDKFKSTSKNNVVGFFIKSIQEGYEFSTAENIHNFEQREYSAEDFEKYYYKVEGSER